MFKKQHLALAIAATLAAGAAHAELETSVVLKNETAWMVKDGLRTGEDTDMFSATGGDGKGVFKFENTAKIFLNDTLENGSSWHGELQVVRDSKAIDGYDGHEANTQKDFLRELYVDTTIGDWDARIGKQQVVWGTADGIKLLDIINPTDWSEFNQNTMADARVPIWMINAEKYLENGGNVQLIVAQNKENKIAGLNSNGDSGHPFVMKGVDAISGQVNGFTNVTPALASVANTFTSGAPLLATKFSAFFDPSVTMMPAGAMGAGSPAVAFTDYDITANAGLIPMAGFTVDGFTDMQFKIAPAAAAMVNSDFNSLTVVNPNDPTQAADPNAGEMAITGSQLLNFFAQCGFDATCAGTAPNANAWATNLMPTTETSISNMSAFMTAWNAADGAEANRTSAFEHMPLASFATFNTFSGRAMAVETDSDGLATQTPYMFDTTANAGNFGIVTAAGDTGTAAAGWTYVGFPGTSASTEYVRDYPKDTEANLGLRFRNTTSNGLNYSLNYFYGYDHNPSVNLSWHDSRTGEELDVVHALYAPGQPGDTGMGLMTGNDADRSTIKAMLAMGAPTAVLLKNDAGDFYGAFDPVTGDVNNPEMNGAAPVVRSDTTLRFTETVNRTQNLGASFDYTLDTKSLGGIVLRGEFLYQKDVATPVVDNLLLSIGDLSNSLSMEKADMFKYVIGADTSVMTDMMVSAQFIQFRNLDYVDQAETCTVKYLGNPGAQGTALEGAYTKDYDCSRYTADMPTMSLTNGLNKAEKNKNFYSLFFSKPFGESGEGRWNNIFIYEEGGGKWNRFDVEYGINDQLIGTFEYNKYFGDENTMFGQFENASNVQIGLKYLLQ